MNVKDYYALRNKDNVYGELGGIQDAYEGRIDQLWWKEFSLEEEQIDLSHRLKAIEKELSQIHGRRVKLKQKLERVKAQEHINRLLLDYDEVLIPQGSQYYSAMLL